MKAYIDLDGTTEAGVGDAVALLVSKKEGGKEERMAQPDPQKRPVIGKIIDDGRAIIYTSNDWELISQ